MKMSVSPLRVAALSSAALIGFLASPALAADEATAIAAAADAAPSEGVADIVVTATKRETSLQKTPISISVLGGADMTNRHAISLESLGDGSIPSLRVAPFFARSSALTIGVRGIGAMGDANQPARDQGVGVYIDGVYLGRAQGLGAALYDIDRIEVLKGPQGTLFGRNTEGGAISIVTKKPTGELGGDITVGAGNYDGREAIGHLNLPEFANIKIKVDALINRRGGTIRDPLPGQGDFNSFNKRGLHAAAVWEPTSDFSVWYSFDISRDATTPYYVQILTAPVSQALAPLIHVQPTRADEANIGVPMQPSVGKTHGHMLTLDWKTTDWLEMKSITSYRKLTQTQFDAGEANLSVYAPNANFNRYSLANFYQNQVSEEVQLLGTLPQVTFVAGGYYYHENVHDDAWTPNTNKWNADGTAYTILPAPGAPANPFPDRASRAITNSLALFGQATWTPDFLNDIAHLTVGGRYTHDKKTGALNLVNGFTPTLNGVTAPLPLNTSSSRVDPLVNLAIDVTPDVHVYGKWSTGYKAGGANSRSLTYRPFGPETLSMFEIGAKTEFWDHKARLNVAAYTGRYNDIQVDFNAVIFVPNTPTRGTLETTNAAGAGRTRGIEADLSLAPIRGLNLTASYAYTDVRLPAAPNPFAAGNPLVVVYPLYTPKHNVSGAIDYSIPVHEEVTFSAHLDANYSTPQITSSNDPTLSDDAFTVNGRVSLGGMKMAQTGATLEFSLWARNLTNHAYAFLKNHNAALGTYGIFNEPRTYGIEARVRF